MKKATDPIGILNLAIEREEGGHKFYKEAAQKIENSKGKRMFEWLAREELGHLKRLEAERESYLKCGEWLKQAEAEIRAVSEPLEHSEFPTVSEATGEVKAITTEVLLGDG